MDAIGLWSLCCHLVSHYFINVLVTQVCTRTRKSDMCSTNIYTATGRNAKDGTSANGYNGLFSFKCTISSTTDTVKYRQTARWVDGHKLT